MFWGERNEQVEVLALMRLDTWKTATNNTPSSKTMWFQVIKAEKKKQAGQVMRRHGKGRGSLDWVDGQGRHPRTGLPSRHPTTMRETAMKVSSGECSRQSWGTRGWVAGERRDVLLKIVEPQLFPTWVSSLESIPTLDRGRTSFCCGCHLVCHKMFSSISEIHPLDASSTCPLVTTKIPLPSNFLPSVSFL